jgi:hypothetical protein
MAKFSGMPWPMNGWSQPIQTKTQTSDGKRTLNKNKKPMTENAPKPVAENALQRADYQ